MSRAPHAFVRRTTRREPEPPPGLGILVVVLILLLVVVVTWRVVVTELAQPACELPFGACAGSGSNPTPSLLDASPAASPSP